MIRRSSSYWCMVYKSCAIKMIDVANKHIIKNIANNSIKFLLISPFIVKDIQTMIQQYFILTYLCR